MITESYALLQQDLPWRPLSVTPHMTWFALLSFVPAVAVFLATLQDRLGWSPHPEPPLGSFRSVQRVPGFLQVAQGPSSPLRLFAITNPQEAVGMFANRNHFAALLYSVLVMTLAWSVATTTELAATIRSKGTYPTHLLVPTILGAALLTALFAAQLMARSRAGIGLSVLILLIALAIPPPKGTVAKARALKGYLLGRFAIAGGLMLLLLVGSSSIYRIVERFDADPLKDSRLPFGRNTIEAALAHMPFGAGIGSFTPVYAAFEKVDDARSAFANRAHNDILEAWLETGVLGIAVFALFIVWALARTLTVSAIATQAGWRAWTPCSRWLQPRSSRSCWYTPSSTIPCAPLPSAAYSRLPVPSCCRRLKLWQRARSARSSRAGGSAVALVLLWTFGRHSRRRPCEHRYTAN